MNTVIEPYSFVHPETGNLYEGKKIKSFENGVLINEEEYYGSTAEEWLVNVGYTPLRLLTCLDFEARLKEINVSSPKLTAIRQWLDQITVNAAPNPDQKRSDWLVPPFSFEQISQEVLTILQSN